jgi:NADPH:quinone reductase-like Zn-dependent oxidoreductase
LATAVLTAVAAVRVVCAVQLLGSGGYAEHVAVDERLLIRIPPKLSFEEAACVPEAWLTAFQLSRLLAEVKAGDTVLVRTIMCARDCQCIE